MDNSIQPRPRSGSKVTRVCVPYFIFQRFARKHRSCSLCRRKVKSVRRRDLWVVWPAAPERKRSFALCISCWRSLRNASVDFEQAFRSARHLLPELARKWVSWNSALEFERVTWGTYFHFDLYQLIRDARVSFLVGAHAGSIILISAAVEGALRCDFRLKSRSEIPKIGLNLPTLNAAIEERIPVMRLLTSEEVAKGRVRESPRPEFIRWRHAIAHGDVMDEVATQMFDVDKSELIAANQLFKGQQFLREWSASPGNPPQSGEYETSANGETTRGWIKRVAAASALNIGFFNPWDKSRWQ